MTVVDIAAHIVRLVSIKPSDPYLITVLDPELFLIVRGDKTDTLFSVFYVLVKPVTAVTVNKNVFIRFIRLKSDQVRILRRVRTETKGKAIVEAALRPTCLNSDTFSKPSFSWKRQLASLSAVMQAMST